MPEDEEHCESCEVAVLGGMALNVCNTMKKKDPDMDCKGLFNQFTDGEITLGELVETVEKNCDDPQELEVLDEIKKIAKGG